LKPSSGLTRILTLKKFKPRRLKGPEHAEKNLADGKKTASEAQPQHQLQGSAQKSPPAQSRVMPKVGERSSNYFISFRDRIQVISGSVSRSVAEEFRLPLSQVMLALARQLLAKLREF
jgi:hypothetical protein